MKAAFACWRERIAPVFDVARQARIVDDAGGATLIELSAGAWPRVAQLADLGISTLVCGAISRPLRAMLEGAGIRVLGFVSGDVDELIAAWRAGRLDSAAQTMPGCCGQRHGLRHGRGRHRRRTTHCRRITPLCPTRPTRPTGPTKTSPK